jgi:hypothetical protein
MIFEKFSLLVSNAQQKPYQCSINFLESENCLISYQKLGLINERF